MKLTSMRLEKFRSVADSGEIAFGNVNLFVGRNNHGKSTFLHALYGLQQGGEWQSQDVRQNTDYALLTASIDGVTPTDLTQAQLVSTNRRISFQIRQEERRFDRFQRVDAVGHGNVDFNGFPSMAPGALFYPYFTRKRANEFHESIGSDSANRVAPDWITLGAKLDQLADREHPFNEAYRETCKKLLGFIVTAVPAGKSKRPGIVTGNTEYILLEQLGAGVANIVVLLVQLVTAEGRVFLIEEPENDLHPAALKALLDVIIDSSSRNQFLISTHDHVAVRYLSGLEDSKLFRVNMTLEGRVPLTAIEELPPEDTAGREQLLVDLGYELSDFGFWDGWLIFEEASAEAIVRDFLIPRFASKLMTFRTVSGSGVHRARQALDDFKRMFLYLHLEPRYKGRAWLVVDGDEAGAEVLEGVRSSYVDWPQDRFQSFKNPDFEDYYPMRFAEEVTKLKALTDKKEIREFKQELAIAVRNWSVGNIEEAAVEWEASAKEVINILVGIQSVAFPDITH